MEDTEQVTRFTLLGLACVVGIAVGAVIALAMIGSILAGIGALLFRGVQFG